MYLSPWVSHPAPRIHQIWPALLTGAVGVDTTAVLAEGDLLGRVLETFRADATARGATRLSNSAAPVSSAPRAGTSRGRHRGRTWGSPHYRHRGQDRHSDADRCPAPRMATRRIRRPISHGSHFCIPDRTCTNSQTESQQPRSRQSGAKWWFQPRFDAWALRPGTSIHRPGTPW